MNSAEGKPGQLNLTLFNAIYDQYHQLIYANILKIVKSPGPAEDILQEVFLALWENRTKLYPGAVGGWLFVTSFNKSLKYLRKKQQEHTTLLPEGGLFLWEPVPEEPLNEELYSLRISLIKEAFNNLPGRKKEVFRLCRYEGKPHEEVAMLLGISVNSVKDYLKQSTRFIKNHISGSAIARAVHFTALSFICLL